MKREWSKRVMVSMLDKSRLGLTWKEVNRLGVPEYNAFGDWLYYYVHFTEKDPMFNRPKPKILDLIPGDK